MSFIGQIEKEGAVHNRIFFSILLALVIGLVSTFFWATSTPGDSYSGELKYPVETQLAGRLESHVTALAASPRNLQSIPTINSTLAYIESQLIGFGYSVKKQEVLSPADNLIVRVRPENDNASRLIIGAHYDTMGASPGADDNASGVAALIELARKLAPLDGKADVELVMVFYANEEPPYFKTNTMGSFVHAQSIKDPDRVIGMISLEAMGYFSEEAGSQNYPFPLSLRYPSKGNFIAFVGDLSAREFLRSKIDGFRRHATIPSVGGTAPASIQGIDWSDHWAYSQQGIPAIMVTDTAIFRNPHYHQRTDTPDTLDYMRLALVVEGIEATLLELM